MVLWSLIIVYIISVVIFQSAGFGDIGATIFGLLGPIIFIIVCVQINNNQQAEEARKKAIKEAMQHQNQVRKSSSFNQFEAQSYANLKELKTILDDDLITQEEYNSKKEEILRRM